MTHPQGDSSTETANSEANDPNDTLETTEEADSRSAASSAAERERAEAKRRLLDTGEKKNFAAMRSAAELRKYAIAFRDAYIEQRRKRKRTATECQQLKARVEEITASQRQIVAVEETKSFLENAEKRIMTAQQMMKIFKKLPFPSLTVSQNLSYIEVLPIFFLSPSVM